LTTETVAAIIGGFPVKSEASNVFHRAALYLSVGTLIAVLATVQLLRLIVSSGPGASLHSERAREGLRLPARERQTETVVQRVFDTR
jgi:hypothetical protein